ncbi:MAG: helix-turn-helix domain-containing protein [Rhodobacteraceae bacterium]|nr:helix-turn-helix domain-containing protein [Paracoccaceae bacterium]
MAFRARVEAQMFGQMLLGQVTSQTQRFERPRRKIIADGLDCYLVQVFLKGTCEVQDGRLTRLVRPGDIYIIDASAPLDAVDYDFTHITAMIPRDLMSQNLTRPDEHHRRIILGETPLAKLLYQYIRIVHANRSGMSINDGFASASALLGLTQSLLNTCLLGTGGQLNDEAVDLSTRAVISDFIDNNLSNPELEPSLIMTALGVSRTRLYQFFQPYGGVTAEIRRRRLRRSLQDLLDPSHRSMRIGGIAFRWGFSSESHYIRAFKRRYEMTPGEAREARRLMPTFEGRRANDYERWIAGFAR